MFGIRMPTESLYTDNGMRKQIYFQTPLHIACHNGHIPVAEALLSSARSDLINLQDRRGQTALHLRYVATSVFRCVFITYLASQLPASFFIFRSSLFTVLLFNCLLGPYIFTIVNFK